MAEAVSAKANVLGSSTASHPLPIPGSDWYSPYHFRQETFVAKGPEDNLHFYPIWLLSLPVRGKS